MRQGYDHVSFAYRSDDEIDPAGPADYEGWLKELLPVLREGDPVLDLGCGCGVPATARLADLYSVTGVDFSAVQIERARRLVPRARFLCEDMSTVNFPPGSFAAIVSFFAIIHLPIDEQPGLFQKLHDWLKPGGHLLVTVGSGAWTGIEEDWHGAPMYWSHADRQTYLQWLNATGFDVGWSRFIPEGTSGHTLIFARRSSGVPFIQ